MSLISFLIVLGVLVIVHEFGHFITAKRIGVRVETFSIGFGPKIFSIKRGGTEYSLSLLPLGGYVKMGGDEPGEKITGAKWEFLSRSVFDRFKIIIAGPLLNYVLAFVIFSAIFMIGSPVPTTEIGGLIKGYPAEAQGLVVGDRIVSIDGKNVKYWEEMTEIIYKHDEKPMKLLVLRAGRTIEKDITPTTNTIKDIFGKETKVSLVGIKPSQNAETVKYGFLQSFQMGFRKLMQLTYITCRALWMIVAGQMSFKDSMAGPIGIFVLTGQMAKQGIVPLLNLVGILSASLAIFNVLPIPVLDGGHILFLALEKIRGKALPLKTQEVIMNVGVTLLILFMVFVVYNDIIKFGIADKAMKLFRG